MDPGRPDEPRAVLDADEAVGKVGLDPVDTGMVWEVLRSGEPPVAVWSAPDGAFVVATGAVDEVVTSGRDRLTRLRERITHRFASIDYRGPAVASPRFFGGMRFTSTKVPSDRWDAFPDSWFFLPKRQVVVDHDDAWLTTIGDRAAPQEAGDRSTGELPKRLDRRAVPPRSGWIDQVESVRREIAEGQYEKVVLAHSLELDLDRRTPLVPLVRYLRRANPACYVTVVQPTAKALFVAATPERLVTRTGSRVRTDALAGSAERGSTPSDDTRLSSALAASPKDRLEHDLVVDAIVDRLELFTGDVDVGERRVHQLRSVQHLHTPICASYPDAPHVLDLVDELHPTPAVGGRPRDAALEAIERLEAIDRGWYAAPIGWVDDSGDGSFAIGIRSAVINDDRACLFAGAGIVGDSTPAAEWDELQLKYRPLLDTFEKE